MTLIIDSFMANDELDMLECRLVELGDVVDFFIVVEADVDHQDHPKPFHISDNLDRFSMWKDKLVVIRATGLPTVEEDPDPWAREHAQREPVAEGLKIIGARPDDIVFHGDIDEIPSRLVARNVKPEGFVAFDQALYCFAVDWKHPDSWRGTVAGRVRDVKSFGAMRDMRNIVRPIPGAGWHLSWLGGTDAQLRKLGSFCHPEIAPRTLDGIEQGIWLDQGWHVDGKKLLPVEVDSTWPRWVYERRCPAAWFRPRDVTPDRVWRPPSGF